MARDKRTTERLAKVISDLISATRTGELHWERRLNSAHRYAQWKDHLLILGPAEPLDSNVPRYLFITPFDSPACIEINSDDEDLGAEVMGLVNSVEEASKEEPPTDPFAITEDVLTRVTS
jgi:hypothetical protein